MIYICYTYTHTNISFANFNHTAIRMIGLVEYNYNAMLRAWHQLLQKITPSKTFERFFNVILSLI